MSSRSDTTQPEVVRPEGDVVIALAGNPNVGKSTLFNALTGLGVSTAHFPGTTREVHTGTSRAGERTLGVIDLPGAYGLSGSPDEERIARATLKALSPDVVVVVVDPATLARNLYLALEVLDNGLPLVIALNLVDEARRAGIVVDSPALSSRLGVPVIPMVATQGVGIEALVASAFDSVGRISRPVEYGRDFEALVEPLVRACETHAVADADGCRVAALSLAEGRTEVTHEVDPAVRAALETVQTTVRGHFGEDVRMHLMRERHGAAGMLAEAVVARAPERGGRLPRGAWALTTWPWTGVPLVVVVTAAIFGFLFFAGELLAGAFSTAWEALASPFLTGVVTALAGDGILGRVLLWGFDAGIEASLAIGLPYILTFYFLMGLLEDTGYLNSLSFLTDRVMHRLGLHGRAIVPLVAAAGCNVPALVAAGQLATKRERRIASTLVLFIPCSARTAVILGSVGHYIGWQPALLVFGIVFVIGFVLALVLGRTLPGQPRGLVMEMFGFRRPSLKRVATKAWEQFREFLFVATPIVIAGSLVLGWFYETGWLLKLSEPLAPVVQGWLGLPAIAGVTLIVGVLRKELSLQLLVALAIASAGVASAGLMDIMSATDLVVYALVNAIALPCISSLAVYWRRQGWVATLAVLLGSVTVALVVGGIVARVLDFVGFGV